MMRWTHSPQLDMRCLFQIFLRRCCLHLQILAILALPVLVVLDEAYIEFSNVPSKLKWVQKYNNLVVLRTFSKSAGLLRTPQSIHLVGY